MTPAQADSRGPAVGDTQLVCTLPTTGCLILDLRMPGMDGLALQERLTAERHRPPIIILTAHGHEDGRARAVTKALGYAGDRAVSAGI